MRIRGPALLALCVIWVLTLALVIPGTYLMVRNWSVFIPGNWGQRGFQLVSALIFVIAGSVISWNHPRNALGWILSIHGLLSSIQGSIIEYAAHALLAAVDPLPGGQTAAWLTNWVWVPLVGMLTIYGFLLFPDGKFVSPRWRIVAWLGGLAIMIASFTLATFPGQLENMTFVENPYGIDAFARGGDALVFASTTPLSLTVVASAASLIVRYRRSTHDVRQQLKWFALAAFLVAIGLPLNGLFRSNSLVVQLYLIASLTAVPVTIAIAILRYRLYDIDVIINRTLVYGLLSAALALLYFGMVAVLQTLFVGLTGQESPLAVVVSTLLIAALFTPLRRGLQDFIDRRFYRKKYDAEKTLEAFSQQMRDEVDFDQLRATLMVAAQDALQPEHVSLWLRDQLPDSGLTERSSS